MASRIASSWAEYDPGGDGPAGARDVAGPPPPPPPPPSLLTGKCPFCLAQVEEAAPEFCPACGTVHHAECWTDAGGCAVVGCGGAAAAASYPAPSTASYPPPLPPSSAPPAPPAPFHAFGSAPVSPARSSRTKLIVAGVAVTVLVLGIIAVMAGGAAESHTVTGDISLYASGSSYLRPGQSCSGTGGYSDLDEGTQVTLQNGKGESLAHASLEPGRYDSSEGACVFNYTLTDVPRATFYRVEVSHRGGLEYSYDEMDDQGWEVHSTLGL